MSKTILVTGGSGFIGTVVCKQLVEQGHNVINIDRKKKEIPGVTQYPFDISNHQVEGIIKLTQPESIIHLAADHEVGRSVIDPGVYYQNNVANTIGLLNIAVECGVKNFVFSSSSTVYGEPEFLPTSELARIQPINPYGRSKTMVEDMMLDYAAAYGLKCVSLRYFNAAGAMPDNSHGYTQDPASHLVPIIAHMVANDEPVTVFGDSYETHDGTACRDYTHVCDIARAHIGAIDLLNSGEFSSGAINIGAGNSHSVLDVIEQFEQVTGKEVKYNIAAARAGDAPVTQADTSVAHKLLNWYPEYTLTDIVEHAWAWETKKKRKK